MIYLNNTLIENKRFPDNTSALKLELYSGMPRITWLYDNDEELFMIYTITKHLQSQGFEVKLYMPYIPNARMDRVKDKEDIERCTYYIDKEANRLLNLVEELLKLSKLGKQEFHIKRVPTDLKQLVEECLTILKLRLENR